MKIFPIVPLPCPWWHLPVSFIVVDSLNQFSRQYQDHFPLFRMTSVTFSVTPQAKNVPRVEIRNNMATHNIILMFHDKLLSGKVLVENMVEIEE